MPNTINAITTGIGGLATTADNSGAISLQSAGSTVAAVTSGGVAVTGTLSATGNITQNGNAVLNAGTAVTVAQGGTGQTTASAAFNALNPMTTTGDIIYEASATTAARLGIGTEGQVLSVASGIPAWATVSSTPTTAQVLSATAGATGGAVGTYAFLGSLSQSNPATIVLNSNYAGSLFVFAGLTVTGGNWATTANEPTYGQYGGGTPSGTWKAMGQNTRGSTENKGTIFLRVA